MFRKIFKKNVSQAVVGVDIGSSAIKVVQLSSKKGKVILDTYGALALGPYAGTEIGSSTNLSTSQITQALKDILRESKVTTRVGAIAIPFNASLMSIIELPEASEKHLKNIIPIEAKKYVPVPISEVSLDWSVIPKNEDEVSDNSGNKSNKKPKTDKDNPDTKKSAEITEQVSPENKKIEVLIVAIHNDIVSRFKEIAQNASLEGDFFEIEIFSTLRSVLSGVSEPAMIMDVGAASTKLYIVKRGNVESSHTINRGSQDITATIARSMRISVKEAEVLKRTKGLSSREDQELGGAIFLTLDYIFAETNKVLRSFREKQKTDLKKIILVGGGSAMKGFAEAASANLQVEVITGDPFSRVETPAFVSDILKTTGPEFAVAVGIAMRRLFEE